MTTMNATASTESLAQAYAWCRDVARTRARNFYYGLKLTPEPQRSAVYAIYAWMRTGDDLVDEGGADAATKRARLDAFTAATNAALAGETSGHDVGAPEMWAAFADANVRFGIERRDIDAMLGGLAEDIDHRGYETYDELKQYCGGVASSVGRVCVTIWGVREGERLDEALELADRRGLAFQLTNILRDFAEDFDEGRVYLPRQAFREFGLTPADVRSWRDDERCANFVLTQAALARGEFNASCDLEGMVTPGCAPTLWAMTRIYSGLLRKIEERPSRVVGEARIRLQSLHKAGIAMRALARSRRGEW